MRLLQKILSYQPINLMLETIEEAEHFIRIIDEYTDLHSKDEDRHLNLPYMLACEMSDAFCSDVQIPFIESDDNND